jgi:hypothetical protein
VGRFRARIRALLVRAEHKVVDEAVVVGRGIVRADHALTEFTDDPLHHERNKEIMLEIPPLAVIQHPGIPHEGMAVHLAMVQDDKDGETT